MKHKQHLQSITDYVKSQLNEPGGHGWDHVQRVVYLCQLIGKREKAETAVLIPAAILHDVARPLEGCNKTIRHEIEGARIAKSFLESINYNSEFIPDIVTAIKTHRFDSSEKPTTLEGEILSDADKLDAMGAIGVARVFMGTGERGGGLQDAIDHFNAKLLKLKDMMYTNTAQGVAEKREKLMLTFLGKLHKDMKWF